MRRLQLLFILFVLFIGYRSSAQLIGGDIFLQGRYLEIGQNFTGAFGTTNNPPAGYHPFPAGPLAETYDYGHDGWTVGTPTFMGDFTYPGGPFEGWGIQIGSAAGLNFATTSSFPPTGFTGTGTLTGSNVSYTNSGGQVIGNWAGTAAGGQLSIKMETRVDTNASWVVVTAKLYNTGATALNNIYYVRSCDPDNDEAHGGSFATNNQVTYQNTDPQHRVGVQAVGQTYSSAYMELCTKDPRAKAFVYTSWPMPSFVTDLSTVYDGTAPISQVFTVGAPDNGDIAIGLCYHICDICPHDSTFISYAYTFRSPKTTIDSAFPEPTLVVNGVPIITPAAPAALHDTFNACLYPGLTVLPVNLTGAASGSWTWATWNWSPGIGLSSTTGLNNNINILALPPSITYTITGTAYAGCAGAACTDSATKVIYLTVLTCNGATVNSPCVGDPLFFNAPGDSTGATYAWYGPNSNTPVPGGGTQSFTVSPSHWSDTGTYYVVKTVGTVHDTSTTYVILHPKPNVTASSNSPLCLGSLDTLDLFSTTDIAVATYGWSGPAGYVSTVQNPTIPGFAIADTGTYRIIVTTAFGCKDTATTHVTELPPPGPPIVTDPNPYCYGAPFIPFSVTGVSGTVYWYPTAAGGVGTTTAPIVNTTLPGTYTYYFRQTVGSCESAIDSITIVVYPPITPNFTYNIHFGCVQDTVSFTNTSTGATSYSWNFGDGTSAVTDVNPVHMFSQPGNIQNVILTATFAGCTKTITEHPDTRHTVQAAFTDIHDTICVGTSTTLNNLSTATVQSGAGVIVSNTWNFGNGTTDVTANPGPVTYVEAGIYPITLTVMDAIGCTSTATHNVNVVSISVDSWHDTTLCLRQPLTLYNTIVETPDLGLSNFTYLWTSPTPGGIGLLDSPTIHQPHFAVAFGDYTYVETVNLVLSWGALCPTQNTMVIHSKQAKPLTHVTASTSILYGGSVQLNADSAVYYFWTPNNGTLNNPNINNPIATPDTTTTYAVYGMDKYGCLDTAYVTVHVDSDMHECIPSGFTPNGDGLNDIFRPVGIKFQNLVDFRVFNRWGQQVFYTNSPEKGWDGTFNGVVQDMGTYFYTIIVSRPGGKGDNIVYKGDVTLIK